MITITTEYLNANWKVIVENSFLPTQFSEWDGGDAYTLAEIGTMPSQKVAIGAIALEDVPLSDFSIIIRLHQRPVS
jgi:hypothetical protein